MSEYFSFSFLNVGLLLALGVILFRLFYGLLRGIETKAIFIFQHLGSFSVLAIVAGIRFEYVPENSIWISVCIGVVQAIVIVLSRTSKVSSSDLSEHQFILAPVIVVFVSIAAILFHFLVHGEALMTWESEVSRQFVASYQEGVTPFQYFSQRLIWDEGLVSTSYSSFLYGAPTYALMYYFGFNAFHFRLISVLLGIASSLAFWSLVSTYFRPRVALFAATIFALHPTLNYYSNYGVSLTGTYLSLILALFFVFRFFEKPQISLLSVPLATFFFYIATLEYSPGRMSVVIFMAMMGLGALIYGVQKRFNMVRWYIILLAACAGTYMFVAQFASESVFYNARGEQLIGFLRQPCWINDLQGMPCTLTTDSPGLLRLTLEVVLPKTFLELARLLHPLFAAQVFSIGYIAVGDPPSLPFYHAALFPFLFLGLGCILKQWRQLKLVTLVVWILLLCGMLLLTSRVDIHRVAVLTIPISLIAALGLDYFCILGNRGAKPWLLWSTLMFCIISTLGELLLRENLKPARELDLIAAELKDIPEPVVVGFRGDHTVRSWLNLLVTERNRTLGSRFNKIISDELTDKLADSAQPPQFCVDRVGELFTDPSQSILVLAPASAYALCALALKDAAYTVDEKKEAESQIYIIHRP